MKSTALSALGHFTMFTFSVHRDPGQTWTVRLDQCRWTNLRFELDCAALHRDLLPRSGSLRPQAQEAHCRSAAKGNNF